MGPGSVLGRFGLQIRILREKLCRMMGSDLFFINFWKFGYPAGPGPGRPRAAISKLGFRNKLKISSRDRKWSLDHLACDQSSAGSNKTSFKSPELLCYFLPFHIYIYNILLNIFSLYLPLNKHPKNSFDS